ncbi:MAG: LLM class flavin-dependent oxidoreductase [Dehalococcoidia bacterium]|nr:LLM class flavin-dependent oxidoreductase [Dehalococcoidia bacterium]
MKYGINITNFGDGFTSNALADLAHEAEESGWDGFFIWDHLAAFKHSDKQLLSIIDPWITLAAIAMRTNHIRIGPMVTPVPRRRPWKLAREAVTLDHLSNGRLNLGVGLGFPDWDEYEQFGESGNANIRAAKLDEGLDVLLGLWSGRPFNYNGEFYVVKGATFHPAPLQVPRIPIWVAGTWPNKKPIRRSARYDGVFPISSDLKHDLRVEDVKDIAKYVNSHRKEHSHFDIVISGTSINESPEKSIDKITRLADAGATWWQERFGPWVGSIEDIQKIVWKGPTKSA